MSEEKSVTLKSVVERQKQFFDTDTTKSVAYRIRMLQKLEQAVRTHEEEILSALYQDLSKSTYAHTACEDRDSRSQYESLHLN